MVYATLLNGRYRTSLETLLYITTNYSSWSVTIDHKVKAQGTKIILQRIILSAQGIPIHWEADVCPSFYMLNHPLTLTRHGLCVNQPGYLSNPFLALPPEGKG